MNRYSQKIESSVDENRWLKRVATALCALILQSACTVASRTEAPDRLMYRCDRGTLLSVQFLDRSEVVEISTDSVKNLQLSAIPGASGIQYGNGRYEFHSKGDEALWTIGRMLPESCRLQKP